MQSRRRQFGVAFGKGLTMKIKMVDVGKQRIRVAIWPSDRQLGTPLLLINGIGGSIEVLRPFAEQLPNTEVIAFDVPGTGASATPVMPLRMGGLAKLVAGMLTQLGYGQVDVLGVSWGGALAQQFAHSFPGRCRRLILAATSTGLFAVPGDPRALWKLMSSSRFNDAESIVKHAGTIYGGVFRKNPEYARQHMSEIVPPRTLGYLGQMYAIWGWTSVHWLFTVKQPTLIMVGRDDPLVPAVNGKIMKALIPNAELVELDCGHLFLVTQAEMAVPIIRGFLDERRSTAAQPALLPAAHSR